MKNKLLYQRNAVTYLQREHLTQVLLSVWHTVKLSVLTQCVGGDAPEDSVFKSTVVRVKHSIRIRLDVNPSSCTAAASEET